MKSIKTLMAIFALLSFTSCNAQIKNLKTETVKIYGNCGMCESTIESKGNLKKVADVDWNQDTKMATLKYDSTKTNQNEILKRIARAGYDSDKFLAPDDAYAKLPTCCQYDRVNKKNKTTIVSTTTNNDVKKDTTLKEEADQLVVIYDLYFAIKDALVQSNGNLAAEKAAALNSAISSIKMEKLSTNEHEVWMKVKDDLAFNAQHIAETKEVEHQRTHFISLSKGMYDLIKVSNPETPVYYQFCPMANDGKGANWLSKENTIKNPYYGSTMLTCGKTVETIK